MHPEQVLVVGGTGAVAQATVKSLLRNGVHTTIFTHSPVNVQQLLLPNQESYNKLLTIVQANYDDLTAFERALAGHSRVFLLLEEEELANIAAIKAALVEKARAAGIQQVLDISAQSIAQAKLDSISQTGAVHRLLDRELFSRRGHSLYGHGLFGHSHYGNGLYLYDSLLGGPSRLLSSPYWVDAERYLNAEAVRRKLFTTVLEERLHSSTDIKNAIISAIVQDRMLHKDADFILGNLFAGLSYQDRLKSSVEINSAIAAALAQDSTVDKYVDSVLHKLSANGLLHHEKIKSSSELASVIAHAITHDHTVDKHFDSIFHNLFYGLSHHGHLTASSNISSVIAAAIGHDRFKDQHARGTLYVSSGEVTSANEYADGFSKVVDRKVVYNGVNATAEERFTHLARTSGAVRGDILVDLFGKQSSVLNLLHHNHHHHSLSEILGRHSQDVFEESYKIIVGKELSAQGRRYVCKL
ncbi:hypothetical protein BJV82DRAFT_638307 [Fennellomyces sp. T-0311]|nr:hypothetical protein BJV82DRAFT_638307 [Fennellomyces sp. T-0311]